MINKSFNLLLLISVIILNSCNFSTSDLNQPISNALMPDIKTRPVTRQDNTDGDIITNINEPTGNISLPEAIAAALAHNPKLKALSLDINAAQARSLQAGLLPNPELEIEVGEIGGTGERSGYDSSETPISSCNIELGGKRSKRMRIASLEQEIVELDYASERLDMINEVIKAFIEIQAAQEQLNLAEEVVRLSEQAYQAAAEKVEAGKNAPVDRTMAKIALSNARIEYEKAGNRLISTRNRLAAAWGSSEPVFEKAAGDFYELADTPELDKLTGLISQNPDVARWSMEKEKRRAALELEKAKKTSDIRLGGGIQYFNEPDDSAIILGLSIPVPLFDRNQGNIKEATYLLAQAQENRRAVETDTRAALAESVTTLSSVFSETTILKNEVLPSAQEAFDVAGRGYNEGKFEYLVVLDAQRTLFEVSEKYIEAVAEYHKARADVERLIGLDIDNQQNLMPVKAMEN